MVSSRKIAAVVNPRSGGGRTHHRWPKVQRLIEERLGPISARFTEAPGAGIQLARDFLDQGFDLILSVGGDGTANEVVNGFFSAQGAKPDHATLGVLPLGTGGDLHRSLGMDKSPEHAIEALVSGTPTLIDAGRATLRQLDGKPVTRYFANLTSFGMGGEVATRAHHAPRFLGGKVTFLWATIRVCFSYSGRRVRVYLDDQPDPVSVFIANVAIGNGRYHGGGMQPCPTALLDDGVLEVTVIDYLNLFELARDVRILYSDNVYRHPKVHHHRARRVRAESDQATYVEVDGEPLGCLPLEVDILPRCLRVIVSHSSPLLAASKP